MTELTIHARPYVLGALYATTDNTGLRLRLVGYAIGTVSPTLTAPDGAVRYIEEPGGEAYVTTAEWWAGMAGERIER